MNNTKKILLLLVFLGIFAISSPILSTFAQEKDAEIQEEIEEITEDTEESATSESIQDIKKIIKENIENSKVKGAINNLINRKIAVIGQVSRITDEAITIKNVAGTRILPLDESPVITKGKTEIDVEKLEVENWVMVLGKLKDDNFSPNFIYVFTKTLRPKNQVVMIGTITSVSSTELVVIPRSGEGEKTLTLSKNTAYQDFDGEEVFAKDFSEDINVLITGFTDEDGDATVSTLKSLASLSDV